MANIELKDMYWASVSGGKDSLYMFRLILEHPEKYPLNGVVHFKLEIDYPWVEDVCKLYKQWCSKLGIPYIEIEPRKSWFELEEKNYFPGRWNRAKWCNFHYKLDCKKQFEKQFKGIANIHWYIGLCADEESRFKDEIYPLAEYGIYEDTVLKWAQSVNIFNNYYINCKRQGCMWCPNSTMKEKAYLLKYYPREYFKMCEYIRRYEIKFNKTVYHKPIDEITDTIMTKYLDKVL